MEQQRTFISVNTNAFLLYYLHLWGSGTVPLRTVNIEQYGPQSGEDFLQSHPLTLAKKTEGARRAFTMLSLGVRVLKNETWGSKGHQKENFATQFM